MQNVVKIVLLSLTGLFCAIQFRSQKQEYAIIISLVVCIMIGGISLLQFQNILQSLAEIEKHFGESKAYMKVLLKVIGVTYISDFASDLCKDSGFHAMAGQIEMFGKLSIMMIGFPILLAVIEQIEKLI